MVRHAAAHTLDMLPVGWRFHRGPSAPTVVRSLLLHTFRMIVEPTGSAAAPPRLSTSGTAGESLITHGRCRFCETPLHHVFADLGMSPLANAYLRAERLNQMEPFYPLRAYVCSECLLVQLEAFESPDHIFGEYAYFSSYSDTGLQRARSFAEMAIASFGLNRDSRVLEIASNDGYLLQHFIERGVAALGIEPAANVAAVAIQKGVPTRVQFFGQKAALDLARENLLADLVIGNNVLAHTPYLNDFVQGVKLVLKPLGVVTMEFPHLMRLIADSQFDTIYHEHFSYFSLESVQRVFDRQGLTIFDVEEIPTHGGSLRIYGRHAENTALPMTARLRRLQQAEADAGLLRLDTYTAFSRRAHEIKCALLQFLIAAKREGKSIVGYGAPAKGNTLLNYCGIGRDFLEYTCDRSPHKQHLFLPGTHIPIVHPDRIADTRPDYVLILSWNLADEIMDQMAHVRRWGGRFVVPIPQVCVYPDGAELRP